MTRMSRPNPICRKMEKLLGAYCDEELSPSAAGKCERHLRSCSRCRQLVRDYRMLSHDLDRFGRQVGEGGDCSLWPAIRAGLLEERDAQRSPGSGKVFARILRPTWVGLALSAAAGLILFFSGVFSTERLPANYCRIESISTPEHNLLIHRGQSDGLTIIWLTE